MSRDDSNGRSSSLSGYDSDSEESELDASDVLAYAKEPEYIEDEIMQMASAEQVGVNADEAAAATADTDPAACLSLIFLTHPSWVVCCFAASNCS